MPLQMVDRPDALHRAWPPSSESVRHGDWRRGADGDVSVADCSSNDSITPQSARACATDGSLCPMLLSSVESRSDVLPHECVLQSASTRRPELAPVVPRVLRMSSRRSSRSWFVRVSLFDEAQRANLFGVSIVGRQSRHDAAAIAATSARLTERSGRTRGTPNQPPASNAPEPRSTPRSPPEKRENAAGWGCRTMVPATVAIPAKHEHALKGLCLK
jgi:hypothetical protein